MYHYTTSGLDNIWLKNGYQLSEYGGEKAVSIHDIDGLHKVIAKGIINKSGILSGKEFKFLRIELDLSQKAIGILMDKSDQCIARWEKGQDQVPLLADKAIRDHYMYKMGDTPMADLLERLSELDREICVKATS